MNVSDLKDAGFAIALLFVVLFLGKTYMDGFFKEKAAAREAKDCDPNIIEVIQNNTRVIDKLFELMQKIITGQKQQDVKMDELLARARENK